MKQQVDYPSDQLLAALKYLKPTGAANHVYLKDGCVVAATLTSGRYRCTDVEHPVVIAEIRVLQSLASASDRVVFTFDEKVKAKAGKATATLTGKVTANEQATLKVAMQLEAGGVSVVLPSPEAARVLQAFTGSKQLAQIFCVDGCMISTDGVSASFLQMTGLPTGSVTSDLFQGYDGSTLTFDTQRVYVHNTHGILAAGYGRMPAQIVRLPKVIAATEDMPGVAVFWADELFDVVKPWATLATDDTIKLTVNPDNADEMQVEVTTRTSQVQDCIPATVDADFAVEMNITALVQYLRHLPVDTYITLHAAEGLPYRLTPSVDLPSLLTARKS